MSVHTTLHMGCSRLCLYNLHLTKVQPILFSSHATTKYQFLIYNEHSKCNGINVSCTKFVELLKYLLKKKYLTYFNLPGCHWVRYQGVPWQKGMLGPLWWNLQAPGSGLEGACVLPEDSPRPCGKLSGTWGVQKPQSWHCSRLCCSQPVQGTKANSGSQNL